MSDTFRVRLASTALYGLLLIATGFAPAFVVQDAPQRESRDPAFARVGDDGRIVVKQDGKERTYALVGVEWPADESHREEASSYLTRLLDGEELRIEPREQKFAASKPSKDDATAPIPAYIRRGPDGLLVNSELIRLGFARVAAKPAFEQLAAFREHEKRARDAGKGVWAGEAPPEKPEVREEKEKPGEDDGRGSRPKPPGGAAMVYITPSGQKYHVKSCRYAKGAEAVSVGEAIQMGKTPCAICKPPVKP